MRVFLITIVCCLTVSNSKANMFSNCENGWADGQLTYPESAGFGG